MPVSTASIVYERCLSDMKRGQRRAAWLINGHLIVMNSHPELGSFCKLTPKIEP
jgi:hypothetical protein